jgi:hypothetical protein
MALLILNEQDKNISPNFFALEVTDCTSHLANNLPSLLILENYEFLLSRNYKMDFHGLPPNCCIDNALAWQAWQAWQGL